MVTEYNGKNVTLEFFFDHVDDAVRSIDKFQEDLLVRLLKRKLKGEARELTANGNFETVK